MEVTSEKKDFPLVLVSRSHTDSIRMVEGTIVQKRLHRYSEY